MSTPPPQLPPDGPARPAAKPGGSGAPAWRDLLPRQPLPALLEALEGHPALGWVLKAAPSLTYVRWSGSVPMGDRRLSRWPERAGASQTAAGGSPLPILAAGQTDADHFDPTQASILRLADLRALRQGQASAEVHRIETREEEEREPALEWRAWRFAFDTPAKPSAPMPDAPAAPATDPNSPPNPAPNPAPEAPAPNRWLLVVWFDMGHTARQETRLAQAHQQIQAQQLLIAQLRAQVPAESAWAAGQQSLAWAQQRFAEQLRRETDLSKREQRSFALILLALRDGEMDDISEQAIMALLARQLPLGVRAMDTVAQIGPRRFGLLLSGAQLTPAYARAEALRRQAASQVSAGQGAPRSVELFIGVAAYPLTAEDAQGLQACAEHALAQALRAPQGCTVLAPVPISSPGATSS